MRMQVTFLCVCVHGGPTRVHMRSYVHTRSYLCVHASADGCARAGRMVLGGVWYRAIAYGAMQRAVLR